MYASLASGALLKDFASSLGFEAAVCVLGICIIMLHAMVK